MSIPIDPASTGAVDPAEAVQEVMAGLAEMEEIRSATYRGRDPSNLVHAVVDGDGFVVRVTFAESARRHKPEVVEDAVRGACADARRQLSAAFEALARRLAGEEETPAQPSATAPALPDPVLGHDLTGGAR